MKKLFTYLALAYCLVGRAQTIPPVVAPPAAEQTLELLPNQGQWPASVRYAAAVPGGHLYLESSALRYVLFQPLGHPHDQPGGAPHPAAQPGAADAVRGHQLWVRFEGARPQAALQPAQATPGTRNYLVGDDPARVASTDGRVPEGR